MQDSELMPSDNTPTTETVVWLYAWPNMLLVQPTNSTNDNIQHPCHDPAASTQFRCRVFLSKLWLHSSTRGQMKHSVTSEETLEHHVLKMPSHRPNRHFFRPRTHRKACGNLSSHACLQCENPALVLGRPAKFLERDLSILTRTPIAGADAKNTRMAIRQSWMLPRGEIGIRMQRRLVPVKVASQLWGLCYARYRRTETSNVHENNGGSCGLMLVSI